MLIDHCVGVDDAGCDSQPGNPLLLDAVANDSAWLADFSEEPVTISDDLYDVILLG